MNNDAELLRRYIEEQSQAAFTELVNRRIGLVYAAALRRVGGDTQLAEDVAQQVFTALAQKAETVRHHPTIVGWLLVSAAHASAATVRAEQRRKQLEVRAMNDPGAQNQPLSHYPASQPAVEEALLELRTEDRDILVLRFLEQSSFAEVARIVRTTEEGARKRVERALEKLRIRLARRGGTSTTVALGLALAGLATATAPSRVAASVASQALAGSTAATSAASSLATLVVSIPVAAMLIGAGWLGYSHHARNEALRVELAGLRATTASVASLEFENARLVRRIQEADNLRQAAASMARENARDMDHVAISEPRRVVARVRITPENTIEWEGTPITLADFVQRLALVASDPAAANGRLNVRAAGTPFSVLSYVIDEAAKAHVAHLSIESDAKPAANEGTDTWF